MLSNQSVISVESVSKRYQLGYWLPGPLQYVTRIFKNKQEFLALDDVSFAVHPGEVLGIIGSNGAGKSTMLKILAGVTKPTLGRVNVQGKISALIELGAGFHPELTGRDNIYLNGAILGMKRREIDRVLNDIIAFAELERFIDTPVKRYSSGMYARLGFSIAVHVNPDVLIVDEVLSVGDFSFQQKSLERMLDFKAQAKGMVFVSHNLVSVQRICNRVIWLDHGQVKLVGNPAEVIEAYKRASRQKTVPADQSASAQNGKLIVSEKAAEVLEVTLLNSRSTDETVYHVGDAIKVQLLVRMSKELSEAAFGVALYRHDGLKLGEASNLFDKVLFGNINGEGCVTFETNSFSLSPGTYYVNVAINDGYLITHDHVPHAAQFHISGDDSQSLQPGPLYLSGEWNYNPSSGSV